MKGNKPQKTIYSFFESLVVDAVSTFSTLLCLCWKPCDDYDQMSVAVSGGLLGILTVSGMQRLMLYRGNQMITCAHDRTFHRHLLDVPEGLTIQSFRDIYGFLLEG